MDSFGVRYCQECGREIVDDFGFCTACGWTYRAEPKSVTGSANVRTEAVTATPDNEEAARAAYQAMQEAFYHQMLESNRKLTVIFLEIWVGMAFFMLSGLLFRSGQFFDTVHLIFGVGADPLLESLVIGISAILAIVSAVLCSVKRFWSVAFVACLGSAGATLALLFFNELICIYFFLCGILTALRVRNIRAAFES